MNVFKSVALNILGSEFSERIVSFSRFSHFVGIIDFILDAINFIFICDFKLTIKMVLEIVSLL